MAAGVLFNLITIMDSTNTYFKIGAIKAGAPEKIVERFNDVGTRGIIEIYKDEIKTWIDAGWPTCDILVDHIGTELLAKYHVHMDDKDFMDGRCSDVFVVGGHSNGEITLAHHEMAIIYALDESEVFVEISGGAYAFIHVHDDAHVTVEQHGAGRVTVKSHSDKSDVMTSGDVKYIDGVAMGTDKYVTVSEAERAELIRKYEEKVARNFVDTK